MRVEWRTELLFRICVHTPQHALTDMIERTAWVQIDTALFIWAMADLFDFLD